MEFRHFSHGHPLKLTEIKHDDEIICSACQKRCSGYTYVCCSSECKFFLHNSCFDLPRNIHHPFHPRHPLTLYSLSQRQCDEPEPICKVCYNFSRGFTYSCDLCKFDIDVECPVITSNISYQGHRHNILFVDGLGPCRKELAYRGIIERLPMNKMPPAMSDIEGAICRACRRECKPASSLFRCVFCDYYLHLECGPLPYSIKHESHLHPLTLTDSPVVIKGLEAEDKLDTDEFYCDTCEKQRDPRLPVYYCSDGCAYLAELKCVISEVMLALRGEFGEVELKSANFHKAGKVISKGMVKGIELHEGELVTKTESHIQEGVRYNYRLFTDEESNEYWNVIKQAKNIDDQTKDGSGSTEQQTTLFSDEGYTQFMKSLDIQDFVYERFWGDYVDVITSDLDPIFEELYAKYGDISAESTLQSSKLKMYFVMMLCGTLRSMCTTRVAEMPENILKSWWRDLRTFQIAGLKVEFLEDRLRRVAHAHYGIRVTGIKNHKEIDKEMTKITKDIEELKAKLMAQTSNLEALKEKRNIAESTKIGKTSEVAECVKEASILKWMLAGEGLL